MARATIATQVVGSDLTLSPIVFTAMVAANDVELTGITKNTVILFNNAGSSGAQVATIVSVADQFGRTGDVSVSVAQGAVGGYGRFNGSNWHQSGTATINVDTADEDNWEIAAVNFDFIL